jgi:2-O-(6-phospho-alpha-D-mannosyl)-D-glycerate hydrolase
MPRYTFHLIPHTHWDREWYLTRAGFLARLVPVLDDLQERLQADEEFRSFLLDGQTVLLEDYLRVRPDRIHRLRALIRSGRLQVGPWYVLADELIPSGESLIRNLLAGRGDAETLGRRTDVLYSPDAFGHPAVWPSLANEFGIRFGVLWRGLGGETGQTCDLYRWRAPDRAEVLLYHLPPDGYEIGSGLIADPDALPEQWGRIREVLVGRASTLQIAVFVGADHHAAHRDLTRLRLLVAELEPEAYVRVSRLDEFFSAARAEGRDLPVLTGELRWSYRYTWTLQGVHATRAPLKRRHAEAELCLERVAEPLAALARWAGATDPRPLLSHAWRTLLQSQFHDSLAGCTADAVARRVKARIADAETLAREVARTSLDALLGNDPDLARDRPEQTSPRLVIWNPATRPRSGIVVAEVTGFVRDILVGPPGGRIPRTGAGAGGLEFLAGASGRRVQFLGRHHRMERLDSAHHYPDQDEVEVVRLAFPAPSVDSLSCAVLDSVPGRGQTEESEVMVAESRLDNGLVSVEVKPDGTLELSDRRTGSQFSGLLSLETECDAGDTYSFAPGPQTGPFGLSAPLQPAILAAGPLVGALELQGSLAPSQGRIAVRLVVSLYAGSSTVRCTLEIENRARNHRFRLRLPTRLPGGTALAGGPFGSVARQISDPDPASYPRETPVRTAPAHRFVAHARRGRGLALLAPGFFEYELTPEGDLLFTVLRAVGELSRADLPTRPGHAAWPTATPRAQCLGRERLQIAFAAVTTEDLESGTMLPELWEDAFLPLRPVWLRQATPLAPRDAALRLEGDGLVFSALKPAEENDGIILRCYNARTTPAEGTWRTTFPVDSAKRVRADEREPSQLSVEDGGRVIRFHAGPHEIVSVLVQRQLTANS